MDIQLHQICRCGHMQDQHYEDVHDLFNPCQMSGCYCQQFKIAKLDLIQLAIDLQILETASQFGNTQPVTLDFSQNVLVLPILKLQLGVEASIMFWLKANGCKRHSNLNLITTLFRKMKAMLNE